MEVKEWPLDRIRPYENNPRNNDAAVDAVADSLQEFGWQQPIVVDRDGIIIAGHTRWKAAQKIGLETAPVVLADDLTEEQVRAYRLADNKTAELAGWDFGKLDAELLKIDEIDMGRFGFDMDDLADRIADVKEDGYNPDLPEDPQTKPGDVWKLGDHLLTCGDSTKESDVRRVINGGGCRPSPNRPAL